MILNLFKNRGGRGGCFLGVKFRLDFGCAWEILFFYFFNTFKNIFVKKSINFIFFKIFYKNLIL
jgi:hypothetical protein